MTMSISRRGFLAFLAAAAASSALPTPAAKAFTLPDLKVGDRFVVELRADRETIRIRGEDGRKIADVPADLVRLLADEYGAAPDIWSGPVVMTLVAS
jgi:hypothetical protein